MTIVKTENVFLGYEVTLQLSKMFYKSNIPFFQITISSHPNMKFSKKEEIINSIFDYVMILPHVPCGTKKHCNGYAFFTKNWMFLNENREIKIYNPNVQVLERIAKSNL